MTRRKFVGKGFSSCMFYLKETCQPRQYHWQFLDICTIDSDRNGPESLTNSFTARLNTVLEPEHIEHLETTLDCSSDVQHFIGLVCIVTKRARTHLNAASHLSSGSFHVALSYIIHPFHSPK